jgi:branched-chain amino acid transport system permease protein
MTALFDLRDTALKRWQATENLRSSPPGRVAIWAVQIAVFFLVVFAIFDPPMGIMVDGICIGALYGLIGVAIILVYRTHRIINFAAAGLGAVPGIALALLVALHGFSWYLAFPLSIVLGAVIGGLTDLIIIRRFAHAPRLILTVATLGVAQLFAFASFYVGLWFGTEGKAAQMTTPLTPHEFRVGQQYYTYDFPFALIVVALAVTGLTLFLRYSRIGIAMRASAENADRASLLGIPVKLVQTASWVLAGGLASTIVFLRSQIVGIPSDGSLGPKVFVFALAAAVIARMDKIPQCLVAGVAIGILADATVLKTGKDSLTAAIMLVIILVVLLVQRTSLSRAQDSGVSTWQAVPEFRPIPLEMRRLTEVTALRVVMAVLVAGFFVLLPFWVGNGGVGYAQLIVISAMIAVSLVILTGWAGQISLGQFGIVGVGAVVVGKLVGDHNVDFFAAMFLAALAGAAIAVLIGLPALRIQGMYLAVTTMLFAAAIQYFALDPTYRFAQIILPKRGNRIRPPLLWGRIKLTDSFGTSGSRNFYWVCLAFLGLVLLMARAYRKNRAGRAVLAVRENTRAAASYSVNSSWTRLGAFAVSGAIAAIAGGLSAYVSGAIDASTYGIDRSISIFIITVVGGLTSLPGAVFGAVALESVRHFGGEKWSLLATGPGLLLVLLFLPGGFAQGFFQLRDGFLRRVAKKHDLLVPSLVADRRVEAKLADETLIEQAEHHVETVETFDVVTEATIWCPVCGVGLSLEDAPAHEHLQGEPEPEPVGVRTRTRTRSRSGR